MASNTSNQQEILHIRHIRDITQRATATIDRWIQLGQFPAAHGKVNGQRYWLKSTISKWQQDVIFKDIADKATGVAA